MSQLSLNLVAISIFLVTMTALLGPLVNLSPAIPAIATFGFLSIATLDSFQWQGQGASLVLDFLAGFSSQHRDRVIRHEAGHFLAAEQLNIPVTGYALTAWEALKQGHAGQGGVRFDTTELETELQAGKLSGQMLDRFCTVWMAGIAAEKLTYGNVEGGSDDRNKLRGVLTQLGISPQECEQKERLAILRAKTLLEANQSAYDVLVNALQQRLSVSECVNQVEQAISTSNP